MTSIFIHKEHIKEHLQELNNAIATGIEKRCATIGFHTSACSINLLELYLHTLGKIQAGTILKHDWFKTPKPEQKLIPLAERKIKVSFPRKEEILPLMYIIEELRNKLIYGKPNPSRAEVAINTLQKVHSIIKEELQNLGEEIE